MNGRKAGNNKQEVWKRLTLLAVSNVLVCAGLIPLLGGGIWKIIILSTSYIGCRVLPYNFSESRYDFCHDHLEGLDVTGQSYGALRQRYIVAFLYTGSSPAAKIRDANSMVSIFANRRLDDIKTWAWTV